MQSTTDLLKGLKNHDQHILAKCLTLSENRLPQSIELLKLLTPSEIPIIGITGPPGAGKSTLLNAMVKEMANNGKSIAILAVDPSSPFNFGALLGDRIRMVDLYENENVFIRSVATRGSLGGLADTIIEMTDLLKSARFDYIFIETVGVGQSEIEVAGLADTTILVLVPESGDEIQTMKAGILEVADIFVVNKSDRPGADSFAKSLALMIHNRKNDGWEPPVISAIANEDKGIQEIMAAIEKHGQTTGNNTKKLQLLAAKAFKLIQASRMADLQPDKLLQKLTEHYDKEGFNLYRFVESYSVG